MLPTSGNSPRGVIFNAYIKEALHSHKDYSQRMGTGESGEASTPNRLSCKQLGQQTPCVVLL